MKIMPKLLTLPGLIDPHVHFRTPGQEHKEDFLTGTKAALAGGFTTVIDMPNNNVPITTFDRLRAKKELAKKEIVCDTGMYFGSLGDNLGEFEKVKGHVKGLKLYLNETTGNFLITQDALKKIFTAWPGEMPILLHAEDDAVAAVIEIIRQTGKKAHFCHISTSSDLKQIIKAKKENLPLTCGVTPHHLFLTERDGKRLQALGWMKPPLRSSEEQAFLWQNLDSIDVIESDHAPHTLEEKQQTPPPYGVPGLETTLPLLLTAVDEGKLKVEDIIRLCHTNPARIFSIKIDSDTKVEVNLWEEYRLEKKDLYTKCGWSPFQGRLMKGKIKQVFLRGTKVFANGKVLAQPGLGKII